MIFNAVELPSIKTQLYISRLQVNDAYLNAVTVWQAKCTISRGTMVLNEKQGFMRETLDRKSLSVVLNRQTRVSH